MFPDSYKFEAFKDDTLQYRTATPVEDIVDLLDFRLSTTNFTYNNTH